MKLILQLISVLAFTFLQLTAYAQLTQEGNSVKSSFKKDFLQSNNKSVSCGGDTLSYSRYNATTTNYINIDPTTSVYGAGLYFHIDDTIVLTGVNFYGYSATLGTPVNVNVYYANTSTKLPAGPPIGTVSKNMRTFSFSLSQNLHRVTFPSPITLTADFMITIETTNSVVLTLATNSWVNGDGFSKKFSAIAINNGWSNNVNVGGVPFDADFFIEPHVSYKMKPNFEVGPNACLSNPVPFEFVNTTTFALNPQFSYEAIDQTLDDNFIWNYGDGSPLDTVTDGLNTYSSNISYWVNLRASVNIWTGTCTDSADVAIPAADLSSDFDITQEGKMVRFKDKSVSAETWDWIFGDGSTGSTMRNPTHIYANYGTFPVRLTVRNKGCTSTTTLIMKLLDYTGVQDLNNAEFNVDFSPNPASDFVEINVDGQLVEDASWNLFNLHGKKIYSSRLESKQRIDLKGYNRGVYFLNFINGNDTQTKRLVLK